jgi:hypothetical protein
MDQFASERIMLGKWLNVQDSGDVVDKTHPPDIVVVPSLSFMCWHVDKSVKFWWPPMGKNVQAYWDSSKISRVGGEIANLGLHRAYWDEVREKHFDPARSQLIVINYSFVYDFEAHKMMLEALHEQPADFVAVVVISSIESNLQQIERNLFTNEDKRMGWSDSAELEIGARTLQLKGGTSSKPNAPLLITLPYPVALVQPMLNYATAGPPRTIGILYQGSDKGSDLRNLIVAHPEFTCADENNKKDFCSICAAHYKGRCRRRDNPLESSADDWAFGAEPRSPELMNNKTPMDKYKRKPSSQSKSLLMMYDLALRSQFCLEPAGDTLTRSHFFVSVLCGCIPVLFDHQRMAWYDAEVPAWWPWRSSPNDPRAKAAHTMLGASSNPFVDFQNFAVVLNASEVVASGQFESYTATLLEMPQKDPRRYAKLRAGVDQVGKLMHYGMDMCKEDNCDAFAAFQGVLERLIKTQRHGRAV